jgi:hypothetical protein
MGAILSSLATTSLNTGRIVTDAVLQTLTLIKKYGKEFGVYTPSLDTN